MKVIIRKPKLLIHIPMHFKKTIQFKTVKVNIKETTTKRASDSQQIIKKNIPIFCILKSHLLHRSVKILPNHNILEC